MMAKKKDALQREQDAFDSVRDALLTEHGGEFVIFKDRKPVGFFGSFDEAYAHALHEFGLDTAFLISQVQPRAEPSVSISWDMGVMFAD